MDNSFGVGLGIGSAVLGPLLLLLFVGLPRNWANRHVGQTVKLANIAVGLTFVLALVCSVMVFVYGRIDRSVVLWSPFQIGVYIDVLSIVMLTLVAFLGMIVCRYTRNYLQGDPAQGEFVKWLCVTIGAVLTLIISGNLILFALAWIATSLSLHQLLVFYRRRNGAVIAARKKFIISRVGDLCLLASIILIYQAFGTESFSELFGHAEAIRRGEMIAPPQLVAIGILLSTGAMLKSAQFPFHSWLPDTMEIPTPVSALMHAGIINAGGFLVLRLSPVLSLVPSALTLLAIIGTITAVFASIVMMTQVSVKRMLAFSTIAQMGFMMLQCGLGAFPVAALHIVAHSLFKAYAFLSSGSVIATAKNKSLATIQPNGSLRTLLISLFAATALFFVASGVMGAAPLSSADTMSLGALFVMALTYLLWTLWRSSITPKLFVVGSVLAAMTSVVYIGLHLGFERLLMPVFHPVAYDVLAHQQIVTAIAIVSFGILLLFQSQIDLWSNQPWGQALYVHARNGFYINTLVNRAIQRVWPVR